MKRFPAKAGIHLSASQALKNGPRLSPGSSENGNCSAKARQGTIGGIELHVVPLASGDFDKREVAR